MTRTAQPSFDLSALVLTEDGHPEAFATVRLLIKSLLQVVDPRVAVQRIDFEPATDDHARRASVANIWRSTAPGDRPSKIALLREIAGKLVEPDGFVFFHFDGDTTWGNRKRCITAGQFRKIVQEGVRKTLRMRLAEQEYSDADAAEIIKNAMPRLLPVVPHYSIEAWCLQNTALGRKLCARHHGGAHSKDFDEWEADRGLLDEIEKPKNRACLRDKHNKSLAGPGFPRDEANKVDKSFAATARAMGKCKALTSALVTTYKNHEPASTRG